MTTSQGRRRRMKAAKWIGVAAGAYVVLVVLFELFLGIVQPRFEGSGIPMLVLTTMDASGESHDRRLARLESGGQLYVSAHHWPRAWYRRALENPEVRVAFEGVAGDYTAVPVVGEEYTRVVEEYPIPLPIRFLMGFPPRDLLRLEPRSEPRPGIE